MSKHRKRSSAKRGMLPGSVVYVGENPPHITRVYIHIFDSQGYERFEQFDEEQIKKALAAKKYVWIDVYGLASVEKISHCCNLFSIHPLIVEDIMHTRQRPKIDLLTDGLFIVFKMLDANAAHDNYGSEQFSMIVKKNLLFTFRESDKHQFANMYHRLETEHNLIRDHDTVYLAYLLMDNIIDGFFDFVEAIDQPLIHIEDLLTTNPETISLQDIYAIKRQTMILRKTIAPLRDIVHLLLSEHSHIIQARYQIYFRDLHDHCLRLLEALDLQREMTNNMLDIYLSTINNRMNETIKVLTLFASIFIPLTFIAGIYGMNFDYIPGLKWRYGYPFIISVMTILALLMVYYFKRKKLL